MKKRFLGLLGVLFVCAACSQSKANDTDQLNNDISQQEEKSLSELITLGSGTYVLSSSKNLDNPLESASITISADSTAVISYKEEGKDSVTYTTAFTASKADSQYDLTGNEIQLDFEQEGIFPFSKGNFFYLKYTKDYVFSISVQSYGVKADGSGYLTAKFVKE